MLKLIQDIQAEQEEDPDAPECDCPNCTAARDEARAAAKQNEDGRFFKLSVPTNSSPTPEVAKIRTSTVFSIANMFLED
ncbi:hypothetical protein M0R72_00155 [Candidatus Pacearchaeota archaeon]|jgi:hypothetical protein|nr:hypothetical protein [Candidatus Pacearchaeota archaeon]